MAAAARLPTATEPVALAPVPIAMASSPAVPFSVLLPAVPVIGSTSSLRIVALALMMVVILVQVFCRYVLNSALPWPDLLKGAGAALYAAEQVALADIRRRRS